MKVYTVSKKKGKVDVSSLIADDLDIIEEEITCRICCDGELELVASLGSCVSVLELCPFAGSNYLRCSLDSCFFACFLVNGQKCEMESFD